MSAMEDRQTDGAMEARAAARWWADRLTADEAQRTGDGLNEAFADFARSKMPAPSPEQIETFRTHLEARILQMIRSPESCWQDALDTGEPHRGSAFRTIMVDYGPDPILKDAADVAGVKALLLPMKTCMWVNPGSVRVSHGYNGADAAVALESAGDKGP